MKQIGQLMKKIVANNNKKQVSIDEKSLFFIFQSVIRQEYGKQGDEQVRPHFLKDKKLFIKVGNSNWANEIWLNREQLVYKLNHEIGWDEIKEIAISQ